MVKVKSSATWIIGSLLIIGVVFTLALFQWINGTTESAKYAGEIFSRFMIYGIGFIFVMLLANARWNFL
jgi:hypothetical protein